MLTRTMLPRVLFAALFLSLCSAVTRAQSVPPPERCRPSEDVPDDGTKAKQEAGITDPQIIVDSVELENPSQIPVDIQQVLIAAVRGHELCNTSSCLDELNEVGIRGVLQQNGYFRAESSIRVDVVSTTSKVEHINLIIHADVGPQYRLGTVGFRSASADEPLVFSDAQLMQFVHMQQGDFFDTDKLRQAFDDLKNFYGEHGYIDFTPTPNFDINDEARIINLDLVLDQQQVYRVRHLEFIAANPQVEQQIRQALIPGQPINSRVLRELGVQNGNVRKNVGSGLADFVFDFRPCRNDAAASSLDLPPTIQPNLRKRSSY